MVQRVRERITIDEIIRVLGQLRSLFNMVYEL